MPASRRLSLDVRLDLGALQLALRLDSDAPRIAIVGPSGAGKSTCLRVLAGLERRARGQLHALGETWQDDTRRHFTPAWRRGAVWVPQDSRLLPHQSVRANLAWAAPPEPELSRIAALLDLAPLLDRRPRHLSGGERQRVALGRALLSRPRLLLLDEPLSALDRAHRAHVAQVISDFTRERAIPLILVSHDERDVAQLGAEVWELENGQLTRA